jgi:putative flippase GtrA
MPSVRRPLSFVVVGAIAMCASLAMFRLALAGGASPFVATALRLATALPILYAGYSRIVLGDVLARDRRQRGRVVAELRMIVTVAFALSLSIGLKLVIEPLLTAWLLEHYGPTVALAAPLVGDLTYGPLAIYAVLASRTRSQRPSRAI